MAEERNENQNQNDENSANNYVENLRKLREKSVSREEYERLLNENKVLADAIANCDYSDNSESEPERISDEDIAKLRARVIKPNSHRNDLEFFEDALELRDAILKNGGGDIFLMSNSDYSPTEADRDEAEAIATSLRECIDFSEGDAKLFENELMRRFGKK